MVRDSDEERTVDGHDLDCRKMYQCITVECLRLDLPWIDNQFQQVLKTSLKTFSQVKRQSGRSSVEHRSRIKSHRNRLKYRYN